MKKKASLPFLLVGINADVVLVVIAVGFVAAAVTLILKLT